MLSSNLKLLKTQKTTVFLIIFLILFVFLGFFLYQKFVGSKEQVAEEVDLVFDAEGPYALLIPRRDGNALILNLKRTSSYDKITYELAYNAEEIDRGVVGEVKTTEKKGEYEQEILFGTCSKNICKYDKGVENGTLTLHIKKNNQAFKMVTQWHLQQPDIALGILTSGDNHFKYEISAKREELNLTGFTIINDLTGVPKLPEGKQVVGKVYALNVPFTRQLLAGQVSIELAEAVSSASIFRWVEKDNQWDELQTQVAGSTLSAKASGQGIFAVLASKK